MAPADRAQTLCQQVDDPPKRFPVLWGLLQFYLGRAELETASALGEQLLSLAQRSPDASRLGEALNGLGTVLVHRGTLDRAHDYLEESRRLTHAQPRDPHALFYGIDLELDSCAHHAHVLWLRGYADQARQVSDEAVALARHLSHPFSLAHSLSLAAMLRQFCREVSAVSERAESAVELAREQVFPLEAARGMILRGWARAQQGQIQEGLADVRQGLSTGQEARARMLHPYYLAVLAELLDTTGQVDEGLNVLNEALEIVDKTGERMYEAELYRLKGDMLLQPALGDEQRAETSLRHALDIARAQQAKAWELRTAISLGRLWQRQSQRGRAHQLLAEILEWFSEGFDTADFQMAKGLLAELEM